MTLKEATANSLLMFVAATCVVLIVKAVAPAPQATPSDAGGSGEGAQEVGVQDGVRVYYFHSNFRCSTCRTIEAYAKEAVETGFSEELSAGTIEWEVVNFQTPGNEHYAVDYEIVAPSVILARFEDGQQVEWKALPEVWNLVGDKQAYLSYVQSNLREFLGETPVQVPPPAAPADLPLPESSDSELPVPEAAEPEHRTPDTTGLESLEPAETPAFSLPIPE